MLPCKALLPARRLMNTLQGFLRHGSTLSYVQRIKLLQSLKEDDNR